MKPLPAMLVRLSGLGLVGTALLSKSYGLLPVAAAYMVLPSFVGERRALPAKGKCQECGGPHARWEHRSRRWKCVACLAPEPQPIDGLERVNRWVKQQDLDTEVAIACIDNFEQVLEALDHPVKVLASVSVGNAGLSRKQLRELRAAVSAKRNSGRTMVLEKGMEVVGYTRLTEQEKELNASLEQITLIRNDLLADLSSPFARGHIERIEK